MLSATPTSIAVSASSNSAVYGQAVSLMANVSASPSPPSEGNVTFFDNGASLGSAPVTSGAAALDNLHLPVGSHSITASYSDTGAAFAPSSTAVGPNSIITTFAGGFGDGLPATAASIGSPANISVDSAGDLFIPDTAFNVVREVQGSTGAINTVAGDGIQAFSGDGGAATAAAIATPKGVAVDSAGDLFIADYINNRVREVNHATGLITTVAGNGTSGYSGDGGQATDAELSAPADVAVNAGVLFIADTENSVIRAVDLSTGVITTVAGNGNNGYGGDGGPATSAELSSPYGIAVDASGDLFIGDTFNLVVREVDHATGVITTVAGNGNYGFGGDGGPATSAELLYPYAVAIDPSTGNLFIADYINNRVREVNHATGLITTVAGNGTAGETGDGGAATAAEINFPAGLAVDSSGNLYIADAGYRIRKVDLSTGVITTAAGNGNLSYAGDGDPASEAQFDIPDGLALDASGNVAIADENNNAVREVDHATGTIATIAGNGTFGFSGDGGAATAAEVGLPLGVAFDASGDLFICDDDGDRVREVDQATGVISTVAGSGTQGFSGDGGAATAAAFRTPASVAVDSSGNLFIADEYNNRIREVDQATGVITTIAGNGTAGFSGDGGAATAAELDAPSAIAIDTTNNLLFIDDQTNSRIREVNLTTGVITTVAGNGTAGFSGDGGAATAAEINQARAIAIDTSGDLFIADTNNNRVRQVNLATGLITTIAGTATAGFSGDGGPASAAQLVSPAALAVDASGNLFVADNSRVRELAIGTMVINVTPAPLTISADDMSKAYGAPLPTLTASYSGFVNGDNAASLAKQPTLSTTATAASHVSGSPYPITVGGASDPNYTITYVPGSLNVTPAPLTITADNKSKVYGAPLPTLTASYSGFVNGDIAANLTTQPTLSTTATAASHVSGSPYPITASGAADSDYTISYVTGSLTVTPVALTITADAKSKAYGAPLPALTASYSGFVNGDTAASLTTQPTLSTTATPTSTPGTYAITVRSAVDPDYTISYIPGTLTVSPAAVQPGSIQFSAATYDASETGGTATIMVTRGGGGSGAVSVTVSTSDGSAKAGTDYTATTKTLTWADGDTAPKNFTIPILDDNGSDETTQTVILNLSNTTGGAALGSQKSATLNITEDNEQSSSGVSFLEGQPGDASDATFVHNLYRNLLGREPEPTGVTFWVGLIEHNGGQAPNMQLGRDRAVADIMNSPEYKEHLVFLMYETLLDRAPDPGGLAFWTAKLGEPGTSGGATGSSDEKFVLAGIAGSPEYYDLHGGTNAGWINGLYQDLLDRAPEARGLAGWQQLAAQQPGDRDGIVRDILASSEAEHKLLNAFYPAADPSIPPPGSPAGGPNALADITGGGWEDLYFQGNFSSPDVNDLFFDELAAQTPWNIVIEQMIESAQYDDAGQRGL